MSGASKEPVRCKENGKMLLIKHKKVAQDYFDLWHETKMSVEI